MIKIFIGYDIRETVSYHVCSNSIIRHAKEPIFLSPLSLPLLHLYNEIHTDSSNSFTYSRFLIPFLMDYNGWAIFLDGDMILTDNIGDLIKLKNDNYAVMVVKHNYKTSSKTKYLGFRNEDYPCKNWSSVMLWNCSHPSNSMLTPEFIKKSSGQVLHRFSWLKEEEIGELPIIWNWLPDEFGKNNEAKILHFTLGTPCFHDFNNSPMAELWHEEKKHMEYFDNFKLG